LITFSGSIVHGGNWRWLPLDEGAGGMLSRIVMRPDFPFTTTSRGLGGCRRVFQVVWGVLRYRQMELLSASGFVWNWGFKMLKNGQNDAINIFQYVSIGKSEDWKFQAFQVVIAAFVGFFSFSCIVLTAIYFDNRSSLRAIEINDISANGSLA
jgi:hypothetical protein